MTVDSRPCVLLTGVTGFLGKVILEGLLRRQEENQLAPFKVLLLIRDSAKLTARQRFEKLKKSKCFSKLNPDCWGAADNHSNSNNNNLQVIVGDLRSERCGLQPAEYSRICPEISHIIHCAASVDFNLPLREAASANIDTTLNILSLAENCPRLQKLVLVSTAYVTPHRDGQILETLSPLPMQVEKLHAKIQAGEVDEKLLLRETGHPNTYTLTKCMAEHLITLYGAHLPITILRPSIISAAWKSPFPGWVDSRAALGGFAALFGAGFLHAMEGRSQTLFDIIPVDVVSDHVISEALLPGPETATPTTTTVAVDPVPIITSSKREPRIVHSVAGLKNSCPAVLMISIGEEFFNANIVARKPSWKYLGPRHTFKYHWYQLTKHKLPIWLASLYYLVNNDAHKLRQVKMVGQGIRKINRCFPYFCRHTFDFVTTPTTGVDVGEDFTPAAYLRVLCAGVHRHLLLGER